MERLVSYGLFPLTFSAAIFAALYGVAQGVQHELILGFITGLTVFIVALFERILPEHPEWNIAQDDVGTDLSHALISMVLLPKALELGMRLTVLAIAVWLSEAIGGSLWPTDWPLFSQVILALIVSQFGEYWTHRAMHRIPLLWRLHATHHSPGRLYWLNAARFHPLDSSLLFVVGMAPLMLLGATSDVMLVFTVWISVHGLFQHCNVKLRLGPLNYIFSMAELHRWHHSLNLEEANANYGNNILFWDLVFGTAFYPSGRRASKEIGLSDMPDFPRDYVGQLISPYRWEHYSATQAPTIDEQ
jgi:ornithine lipid hydroxylase